MGDGYSICFNEWALDKDIKDELGLLLIISSLTAEKGYCYASNNYLAEIFKTNVVTISRKIKNLEEKKYISIEYEKKGCLVISRKIRLTKMLTAINKNVNRTINKNVKDNNTNINNTNINNIYTETSKKEKFGIYGRIKLTQKEYDKLIKEFGEDFINKQIELLDEYVESNNNKNKYSNFNLVLRKSIREKWFKQNTSLKYLKDNFKGTEIEEEEKKEAEELLKQFK